MSVLSSDWQKRWGARRSRDGVRGRDGVLSSFLALNYSPYLQYDKALADGVPIATGVIEGACRHLVEDRMNLTGARWRLSGAEAVLRLRALRSSDDFDAYWKFHEEQEHKGNHASHYVDHHVPNVVLPAAVSSQPSRRSTLKIVKKKGES
jgi:hypothetical protein